MGSMRALCDVGEEGPAKRAGATAARRGFRDPRRGSTILRAAPFATLRKGPGQRIAMSSFTVNTSTVCGENTTW
jgi:hypothetical protein